MTEYRKQFLPTPGLSPRARPVDPTVSALPDWVFAGPGAVPSSLLTQDANKLVLTVDETADLLRVSNRTVRRLIASGQLSVVQVGRRTRVSRYAIEQMITFSAARKSRQKS